jgi:hypothetical protein
MRIDPRDALSSCIHAILPDAIFPNNLYSDSQHIHGSPADIFPGVPSAESLAWRVACPQEGFVTRGENASYLRDPEAATLNGHNMISPHEELGAYYSAGTESPPGQCIWAVPSTGSLDPWIEIPGLSFHPDEGAYLFAQQGESDCGQMFDLGTNDTIQDCESATSSAICTLSETPDVEPTTPSE